MIDAHRDRFGIAALLGHCQHPVTNMEAGYLRSDIRYHTGRAFAGNERQRRQKLVSATDHQKIYVIDRFGMYPTNTSSGRATGLSGLADAQSLGGAEAIDHDRTPRAADRER
jgi:hypothetical protein